MYLLDLIHHHDVIPRYQTDLLALVVEEQCRSRQLPARNHGRIAADVIKHERLPGALRSEFAEVDARLNERDNAAQKKHLLRQRMNGRIELAAGHEQIDPLRQRELLASIPKVIDVNARRLERLEIHHPYLPLLHILAVGRHISQRPEPPHPSLQEHGVFVDYCFLDHGLVDVQNRNSEFMGVGRKIHRDAEVVQQPDLFLLPKAIQDRVLLRLLRQIIGHKTHDFSSSILLQRVALQELAYDPLTDIDRNAPCPKASLGHEAFVDNDLAIVVSCFHFIWVHVQSIR